MIPGWGPIAGAAAGALMGGSGDQSQANSLYGQAAGSAGLMSGLQSQYLPGIIQQLTLMGQNPYGQSDALASRYADNAAGNYQKSANLTNMSMAGRGFTGSNSITPQLQASLARGATQDVANNNRQTGIDASNAQYQRLMSVAGLLSGNTTGASLSAAAPYQSLANGSQQAAATAGGLATGQGGYNLFGQLFGHNGLFGQGGYTLKPGGNTNSSGAPVTYNGNTNPTLMA